MPQLRPEINTIKNGTELKKWYWTKQELINSCRFYKLRYTGSKFEILDRIADFLDGKKTPYKKEVTEKNELFFNWATSKLELSTIITTTYKNTENVRKFFKSHCGTSFKFNIAFMNFMKHNAGKTLNDALQEYKRLQNLQKQKGYNAKIPEGNQYNQYIRDFFAANPGKTINDARKCWKLKRALPLGKHKYEKTDLLLK